MMETGRMVLTIFVIIFALALFAFIGFMLYSSWKEKQAAQEEKLTPRADTLAEQIKNQFKVEDEKKERLIHTKSGISRTAVKLQTKSAFSFKDEDAETGLSLESEFDNGPEKPFISPDDKI